ncbi:MAG: hypothetical protein IKK73_04460 [Akkermansia sp.]|nr:hypothetical protein [Akkermansia sp.]
MAGAIRFLRIPLRWWCMAVSFPVGLGSGLLPRPLVVLPPEAVEYPRVEKEDFPVFRLFSLFYEQEL